MDDFFKQYVPLAFRIWRGAHPIEGMEGSEFTIQYRIAGEGGGTYGIRVRDGTEIEILNGEMDHAMLSIEMSEKDWRDVVTGRYGGADEWMQSQERPKNEQLETLRGIQGTLDLELERPEGGVLESKIIFNMADVPRVLLKMKLDDYVAMQKGELRGQEAFILRKIRNPNISFRHLTSTDRQDRLSSNPPGSLIPLRCH